MGGPDGRQAVPQRPGERERAPGGITALVVGGGLAGIAAACSLAERGVRVTIVEREESLGGRLRTWPESLPDGSEPSIEITSAELSLILEGIDLSKAQRRKRYSRIA